MFQICVGPSNLPEAFARMAPAAPFAAYPEPPGERADDIAGERRRGRDGEDAERDRPRGVVDPEQEAAELARRLRGRGGIDDRVVPQLPAPDMIGGPVHWRDG